MKALREATYHRIRKFLLRNTEGLINLEKRYMDFLTGMIMASVTDIDRDFLRAGELIPFWTHYSPRQRGRAPTGLATPWSEVGQTTISLHLLQAIVRSAEQVTFPGLPFGGDLRFASKQALLHVDVKSTGPNDNPDEVVVPPQQLSGDGAEWKDGVRNTPHFVRASRGIETKGFNFQPKLAPFYTLDGKVKVCLTFFLKGIYTVNAPGNQPLSYLELVCVPNGLLLFDSYKYAGVKGLFIAGKDDKTVPESYKRVRVRLPPLAQFAPWRCVMIKRDQSGAWQATPRYTAPSP